MFSFGTQWYMDDKADCDLWPLVTQINLVCYVVVHGGKRSPRMTPQITFISMLHEQWTITENLGLMMMNMVRPWKAPVLQK